MSRFLMAILVIGLSGTALGQTYNSPPQDGYWWNPLESGRGWTIESQNETVVITHYAYDTAGRATFFQNASTWNSATRSLVTTLLGFSGGQCVGCPYSNPTIANLGTVTFTFTSSTRGRITYPNGVSIPIERFLFDYSDPRAYLRGIWASVWTSGGADFGNFVYFNANCAGCTVPNSVSGRLVFTSASGRPVLGGPTSAGSSVFLIVIDASPSFFDYYYVLSEANSWEGLACTRLKTEPAPTLSSCEGIMYASRASTQAEAAAVIGPASSEYPKSQGYSDETARLRASSGGNRSAAVERLVRRLVESSEDEVQLLNKLQSIKTQLATPVTRELE